MFWRIRNKKGSLLVWKTCLASSRGSSSTRHRRVWNTFLTQPGRLEAECRKVNALDLKTCEGTRFWASSLRVHVGLHDDRPKLFRYTSTWGLLGGHAVDGTARTLDPFLVSLLKRRQAASEAVGTPLTTKVGARVTNTAYVLYVHPALISDTRHSREEGGESREAPTYGVVCQVSLTSCCRPRGYYSTPSAAPPASPTPCFAYFRV